MFLYKYFVPVIGTDYVTAEVKCYHDIKDYHKHSEAKFKVGQFEINHGHDCAIYTELYVTIYLSAETINQTIVLRPSPSLLKRL